MKGEVDDDKVVVGVSLLAARYILDNLTQALDLYSRGALPLDADDYLALRQAHKKYWVALDKRRKNKRRILSH